MSAETEQAVETVNIEVDGVAMQVPKGSMIIEATDKAGIDVPRFCYHPKLSIAANCRMCLVDVEKMPKPVPACATPVMEGMKVYTESRRTLDAQHGVMEFLLINHPLDCPICDQGGECELQDVAMGYGRSVSRFTERKRVVADKDIGPLVQTDMTRCIHCTRCIRFLEEIAGTCEMGGIGRGDRLEIGTGVETSIESELSGNIIDVCPVGALTNKPFRFSARAWELMARPSIAAHDGVGSHLWHHVRRGKVLRSVPRDNEALNEAWLSDRDRFSHLGLYAADRLAMPEVKEDGEWKPVSWNEAIETVAAALKDSAEEHGAEQCGLLMSPSAASEEYFLAQSLFRQLGSPNIDHRLREQDFSDDGARPLSPAFERTVAGIQESDVIVLVGCNPREEAPIVGHRVRQAWRGGAKISAVNPLDWAFTFDTDLDAIVPPREMVAELAALAAAVEQASGEAAPDSLRSALTAAAPVDRHAKLAERLRDARAGLVLLGQFAMGHPQAAWLRALAKYIAAATGSQLNTLPHGGNAVGAWLAGAVPHRGPGGKPADAGLNVSGMLANPLKCYVLWDIEPDFDIDDPAAAMAALAGADRVIAVTAFVSDSLREVADVILPLALHAESEGSLVNLDGDTLPWTAAARPQGQARPGWKILRRLGGELGLPGFGQVSIGEVQGELQAALEGAAVQAAQPVLETVAAGDGIYRIGEVPIYSVDALCRRAGALQETAHARNDFLGLNPADAARLGLEEGAEAAISQGGAAIRLKVRVTGRVPEGGAWLRCATDATRALGRAIAPLEVEAGR